MKIKRKTFVGGLLAALCACTALTFGTFFSSNNNTKTANAATLSVDITPTSLDGTSTPFSGAALLELYDTIMGSSYANGGSYKKLEKWLDQNVAGNTKAGVSTPALTYTQLGDLSVTFGGQDWQIVYLTKDINDEVVATLWLKDINGQSKYASGGGYSTSMACQNPSGVYATSYLKSQALGNGGLYYNYNSNNSGTNPVASTSYPAGNGNFAKFAVGTLSSYIDAPELIDYQATESCQQAGVWSNNYIPNEAYGVSSSTASVGGDLGYLSSAVNTGAWKTDKVWIPSLAEIGCNSSNYGSGIWDTGKSSIMNASDRYWTRSGTWQYMHHCVAITAGGGYFSDTYTGLNTCKEAGVRPAVHLNLKKADEAADYQYLSHPGNIEFTYDGTEYTELSSVITRVQDGILKSPADANAETGTALKFTDISGNNKATIKWFDSVLTEMSGTGHTANSGINFTIEYKQVGKTSYTTLTDFKIKDAGEYKIKCELASTNFKWRDMASGAYSTDDKTFTITVKQLDVKYNWANIGLDSSWGTTFAQTFTPATGTSAAPWVYLNYTLPVTADNTASGGSGGTVSNDTVPYVLLTFTGTQSRFADYKISDIDNVRSTTSKGSDYPKHADTYTVSFTDKNAKTSNYKLVADTGESATRQYIIHRLKVDVPTAPAALTYNGADQPFSNVPKFDSKFMTYGQMAADGVTYNENATPVQSDGTTPKMTASVTANKLTLTAKDADKYDMYYRLLTEANTSSVQEVRDYMWTDATAADPAPVRKVTYEIKAKTLEFTFSSSSNSWSIKNNDETNKLTYDYASGKGPAAGEEPVLELYYYLNSDGETNAVKHSDSTQLLFKDLTDKNNTHATGKYTIVIKLADCDDTTNTVNKNYILNSELLDGLTGSDLDAAKATYQKELTITAGEASIDDIEIFYNTAKREADGMPAAAIPSGGLTYEYDSLTKQVTEYKFELDFSNIDYLTYADTISWKYADGETTATKAGKLTVTVKIKVKDAEAANHVLPAAFDVTQSNKFKSYLNNGDGTATLTFEIEINKHEISVAGSDIPLKYQREGGQVTDYDPKNPPEFNGKPVTISLPHESLYPHGIKSIEFDEATPKKTQAGSYTIGATITLDDNHVLASGGSTVHVEIPWEISKEVIKLAWGKPVYFDDYFNDSTVAHLQVMLLSGLTEAQEGAVKYSFYKDPDGAPLSDAELKALCTNDRFTDSNETWLYVKAELTEDGAKKYKLEDDDTKNPKRFKLGGQMTLIELKVDESKIDGYEYGGELDLSKVFTLINTETGDPWDSSYYEIRVFKDGVDIGEISEFNPAENGAGKYVIKINIKPEFAEDYTLDKSNSVDFEIQRKAISLPTLSEILFSGEYINLADYLGGSYAEYKNIISISGDCLDIRNVSKNGYKARLELTDPNYKWAQPTTAEPASLKLFAAKLFDNQITLIDDAIAELNWNITPLVIDTTELWAKGKNGATLNLPENIAKLITAETLSVGYKYYDDADQYIETPELKGGKSFRVEAVFGGIDAESGNVVFKTADGNFGAVSDKISYTVPQSAAAAFFGSTLSFLKANWLWLVIAAVALLFLIILICVIASAKKKKRKREELEEQRRLEKEEREREERKLEREERMARLNQQQQMPQMQMPQMMMPPMMPQMMQMPQQQQPQYAPQQPVMSGGGSSNEIAELKAEISAMKAEAAAKESAALRAEVMRAEQAAMKAEQNAVLRSDVNAIRSGEQFSGINMDAMTEIMTRALKNVFASAVQQPVVTAPPAQPAQLTEGTSSTATANAVYPPDAVMTTVTTTKIDTTKKPAQPAQNADRAAAPAGRTIVRNVVAPMPVDDGRIFDVGGFYKPADPVDMGFTDEENKD